MIQARTCNPNLIAGCWEFIPAGSCTCLFLFDLGQHLSPTCPFNKLSPGSRATTAHVSAGGEKAGAPDTPAKRRKQQP
jgi:hypothetical protein